MTTVTVEEAEANFGAILERAITGEEILIARGDHPVARLSPVAGAHRRRVPGSARGKIHLSPDFDEPLSEEILEAFEQ